MAIFAIIGQPGANAEKLPAAILREFPENYLEVQGNTWLVASKGTVQEVSEKLGISDGANGSAIVLAMSTYYGRASPNIWAWIKEKWESTGG